MFEAPTPLLSDERIAALRAENRANLTRCFNERVSDVPFMPVHLMIEPTNTCNAKCPLCPTGAGELNRAKAFLDEGLYRSFLDQAYPYAETMNLWNFGEPFLHPGAFDFIRYAQERKVKVTVSTNGYVFYKEENVERLIDSGLHYLVVALDGATEEVFNQYRVNVKFQKVLRGLKLLQEAKKRRGSSHPIVDIQFIVMKHNQHELEAVKAIAEEHGALFSAKTVDLGMLDQLPEHVDAPDELALRRYERSQQREQLTLRRERQNHCYFLWNMLVLNAGGEIVPCCYDIKSELVLGKLTEQPLREIWNGERTQALRRRILTDRMSIKACSICSMDAFDILFVERPDTEAMKANRALYAGSAEGELDAPKRAAGAAK